MRFVAHEHIVLVNVASSFELLRNRHVQLFRHRMLVFLFLLFVILASISAGSSYNALPVRFSLLILPVHLIRAQL
ncbi:hypothetical protein D3C84_1219170 [compost metagenome]